MTDRERWTIAIVGTLLVIAVYAGVFIPAYRACRSDGGTFWTCSHWLMR